MQVREPAWELLREDGSCCGEIGCVGQRSGSSPALLLAVLTLQCAAKPYWWHGGQPAQATTYRASVRRKRPRTPPIGLTCAPVGPHSTYRVDVRIGGPRLSPVG